MQIETSRFGAIEIDPSRVLTVSGGLLGFPQATTFALIQTGEENFFFWLQSTVDPTLAFVVCDPADFVDGFDVGQVPVREEARAELGLSEDADLFETTQVFAICNRVDDWLTGNLLGPIVVAVETCRAKQIVLTERRWSTRQPLMKLGAAAGGAMRKSA